MLAGFATSLWQHDFLRKLPQNVAAEDQTDYFTILRAAVFALPAHLAFFIFFWFSHSQLLAIYNLFSLIIWLVVIQLARRARFSQAIILAGSEVVLHSTLAAISLGTEFGFQLYLWPAACIIAIHRQTKMLSAAIFAVTTFFVFVYLELNFTNVSGGDLFRGYELYFYGFFLISGGIPFIVGMMTMKSVYMRQREKVEQFANIDQLTGLFNRRYFYNFLHFQKFQSKKDNSFFSIAIGDIDHFKILNDRLGHEKGDMVLKEVARVIKKSIGDSNKACRWGGEEFLIFLDNYNPEQSNSLLNQVRRDIQLHFAKVSEEAVTISFGAVCGRGDFSLDELVFRADELLYEAKYSGRNKVMVSGNSKGNVK